MNDLLRAKWEKGKNNTLRFYRRKLPWKATAFNHELYLPDYFETMIGKKKEVAIAELGTGMFCTIGSLWKTAKVSIYPSDALADEFNQILKDHGVIPIIPVEKQDMENLSYPDSFFDIVYCCNALDHSTDPIKGLKEMYRVCKPGGYIYLRHSVNVGENEKYSGLHMWNLDTDDSHDCLIWNRENRFSLRDFIPGFKNTIQPAPGYNQIISILHKK
jgi:ubiquinone/menaquinone biosynthesis C-methylase UbiE